MNKPSNSADLAIAALARAGLIGDAAIAERAELFAVWDEHWRGERGSLARDAGALYRCLRDVSAAAQNMRPSESPGTWRIVLDPDEEWPPWCAPVGLPDAYDECAQVTHRGIRWISELGGNTWEPGIFGWCEAG